jgi:ABC-type transport system substrate-binding protein
MQSKALGCQVAKNSTAEGGGHRPLQFVEHKLGSHVLYKRVENHWRKTQIASNSAGSEGSHPSGLLMAGEVHISDVDRALQKDAIAKGMKISASKLPAMQHQWQFGGMYFATPDKLDPKNPFGQIKVRQAMNMAVNRQAIAQNLLNGNVQPHRVMGSSAAQHCDLARIWNPEWDKHFEERFGYDPAKAKALLAQADTPGLWFTCTFTPCQGSRSCRYGQAMALDFQAIGLKPKLVETEFPRVRELYRTQTIHGALFPTRHADQALTVARNVHKSKDSLGHWYEHPVIDERLDALTTVVDAAERARLLREIGDHKVNEFAEIPLFWLYAEAAVNPKYIAEYAFPGVITGYFTHLEYIKLAP